MKVEAKLFEFLTAFFFLAGILYTVATAIWGPGYGYGAVEWVGVTGMFLTGGLTLIIGTYFRFVSSRVDTRPEVSLEEPPRWAWRPRPPRCPLSPGPSRR